jgi:hypothetical protein
MKPGARSIKTMDCNEVKDLFSTLVEKELSFLEEEEVRRHIEACSGCRQEYGSFEKMMKWLHSVEEVEVPEGFLSGILQKKEERKGRILRHSKWKLPIQASAMVASLFLVIYLTRIVEVETPRMKEREAKAPATQEGAKEKPPAPKLVGKAESTRRSSPKTESPSVEQPRLRTEEREALPSLSGKKEPEDKSVKAAAVAPKPPLEIILKVSDRGKTFSQLKELIAQYGGETLKAEENALVASLPFHSFPEFEREVMGLSSPGEADKRMPSQVFKEKAREPAPSSYSEEEPLTVRILLQSE